jgi:hypothetical protein
MHLKIVRYRTRTTVEPFEIVAADMPVVSEAGIVSLRAFQARQVVRALTCRAPAGTPASAHEDATEDVIEDVDSFDAACASAGDAPALIFADDLWFSPEFMAQFLAAARSSPAMAAASAPAIAQAALASHSVLVREFIAPLCEVEPCVIDGEPHSRLPMFYKPPGVAASTVARAPRPTHFSRIAILPLAVPFEEAHCEHLSLPPIGETVRETANAPFAFFREKLPDIIDFAPLRIATARAAALPLRHWSHLLTANLVFGVYGDMLRLAAGAEPIVFRAGVNAGVGSSLDLRKLVILGRNVRIDPSAIVIGPTVIGDDVTIEAGACVSASVIGNGCIIGQGAQIRLSVLGAQTILPPGGGNLLLWAQTFGQSLINSPLRYSVVGRDCFIAAQVSVTDRVLDDGPDSARVSFGGREVRVRTPTGLRPSGYWFLGAGIGPHCRVGSGLQFYPGRILPAHSRVYAHNVGPDFAIDPVRAIARQRAAEHAARITYDSAVTARRRRDPLAAI